MRGQPVVGGIERDRQYHAPEQDRDEGAQQDERPVDQAGQQHEANGDLDHLFASSSLPRFRGRFEVHDYSRPMRPASFLTRRSMDVWLDPDQPADERLKATAADLRTAAKTTSLRPGTCRRRILPA